MKHYTILVVDDSPDNLKTIVDYLKESELPLTILKAPNGKMACKIAEKKLPDLIITDWEMPEMNGIETIKHLKSRESTKDIPVIMASGAMTLTENLKTALDAGAVDYIRKPIDKTELTARVYSMLKLAESYKEIKLLNATKDKFFSIIAHDLRAPLGGLQNLTDLLYNEYNTYDEESLKNTIKLLYESSKTTFNLLENLLTWSSLQRNKITYKPERFSINQIISENISLLENCAKEKEISIINDCKKEIHVFADKNMILTVLRNLISNAVKFTPKKGKITIGSKLIDEKTVQVWIADTGIGISKENILKLFSIEQVFTTIGTEKETGTGLGLILCKEFIEKNRGEIKLESESGKGTTFFVELPVQRRKT